MEIIGKNASIILEFELLLHLRQANDITLEEMKDIDEFLRSNFSKYIVVSKLCK